MQVAILGLSGKGKIVLEKLLNGGHEIVLWSNSKEDIELIRTESAEFVVSQKLRIVHSLEELQNILRKPVIVWISALVGEPTESLISQIGQIVGASDVVVDGGDSNYNDTQRRAIDFEKRGVRFLGIGVAGGDHASENGFALMAGGDFEAYKYINPILESLIKPNGTKSYFGSGGAGHFVSMVHAGIESGIAHTIAEGLSLLKKSDYEIDLMEAANTWQGGGTVSSFLLDMAMDALDENPELENLDGNLSANQSARWMVEDAKSRGINVSVIAQVLDFEARSQYDKLISDSFTARLIQGMKKELGG